MAFTHKLDMIQDHPHDTVAQARQCEADWEEDQRQQADWEIQSEASIERWFENRGYNEARAQEDWEAARGVVSFEDAMAAAYAEVGV